MYVRHDLAGVLRAPQGAPDQFVYGHGLGAGDFDGAIGRRFEGDVELVKKGFLIARNALRPLIA